MPLLQMLAAAGILLIAVTIFVNAGLQSAIGRIDHPLAQWFYSTIVNAEAAAHGWFMQTWNDETRARSMFIWVGWVFISVFLFVVLRMTIRSRG